MKTTVLFANSTIAFGIISLVCLFTLHFVSQEFKPGFRMVSEYALGNYKWLLTLFFLCWGFCSITSGLVLWNVVTTVWAKLGIIFLFVSGIGAIMGGLFDVQHKLHGLSFGLGVPFLPIGALLITYHLLNKPDWQSYRVSLLFSSHSVWISLVLMGGAMFLFFSSLKSAGIAYGPNAAPLTVLPKGVTSVHGWANRLLVLCYILYPLLTAKIFLTLFENKN